MTAELTSLRRSVNASEVQLNMSWGSQVPEIVSQTRDARPCEPVGQAVIASSPKGVRGHHIWAKLRGHASYTTAKSHCDEYKCCSYIVLLLHVQCGTCYPLFLFFMHSSPKLMTITFTILINLFTSFELKKVQ